VKDQFKEASIMEGSVVRLEFQGPSGEQFFLIVDFSSKNVSLVMVDVRTGNLRVTDVQTITMRGN
jgi:hypothetical protein